MSHTCRGTINLANAFIHTEDSCSFVISNGGTQSFHLKASSEVERQKWVTALELAKARAIVVMESGSFIFQCHRQSYCFSESFIPILASSTVTGKYNLGLRNHSQFIFVFFLLEHFLYNYQN